jgi:microcystin degradation protein MlrC
LAEVESATVDTHYILSKQRAAHDQALAIYRRHVPQDLRDAYEKATDTFRSVRENVQPAMLSFLQQQVGERPSGSTREEVVASIQAILAFAA